MNGGTLRAVIEPQLAAMGLDNRSAQGQSDAETFGLVGRQRQKCIFHELGRKSGSGINDSHFNKIGVEDFCIDQDGSAQDFALLDDRRLRTDC